MLWLILLLNLATVAIALKKRVLPYSLLTAAFIYLVVGQAFQIQIDLEKQNSVLYLNNFINESGFRASVWYIFGISICSLFLVMFSKGYQRFSLPAAGCVFRPPIWFYIVLLLALTVFSCLLIFVVVGLSQFLHSSRPGFQSGSTIFIVLLFLGMMPILLKTIYVGKIGPWDAACFLVTFSVTAGFSRVHLILYLVVLLFGLYYTRGWADRKLSFSLLAKIAVFGGAVAVIIVGIGSLRDAQNFTRGSTSDIFKYILANPDKSVLSVEYNYRVGVEGMSGIAGAFTQALSRPESQRPDLGASWLIVGATQWLPAGIKENLDSFIKMGGDLNWYSGSILAPGMESFFMSYGWSGMLLYSLLFYVIAWLLPLQMLKRNWSPPVKMSAYVFVACGLFFVRGSLPIWIAFTFSFTVMIFLFWPFFKAFVVREIEFDSRGQAGAVSRTKTARVTSTTSEAS